MAPSVLTHKMLLWICTLELKLWKSCTFRKQTKNFSTSLCYIFRYFEKKVNIGNYRLRLIWDFVPAGIRVGTLMALCLFFSSIFFYEYVKMIRTGILDSKWISNQGKANVIFLNRWI